MPPHEHACGGGYRFLLTTKLVESRRQSSHEGINAGATKAQPTKRSEERPEERSREVGMPNADQSITAPWVGSAGINSVSGTSVLADPAVYVGCIRDICNLTRLAKWKGFSNQSQ